MRLSIHHFVVTSVLAHAALFAAWNGTPSRHMMIPAAEASAPTLHVALQSQDTTIHKQTKQQRVHQVKVRKIHRQEITPQRQIARTLKIRPTTPPFHISNPVVVSTRSAYQAQLRRDEIRNRVLTRIRTDLRQYFVYPPLAQRRGWQGRVVLAFSVEANGAIHNIRVASGSGYPILDTSAVTALSRVHQLYSDIDAIHGKSMYLKLPVIFELQGG